MMTHIIMLFEILSMGCSRANVRFLHIQHIQRSWFIVLIGFVLIVFKTISCMSAPLLESLLHCAPWRTYYNNMTQLKTCKTRSTLRKSFASGRYFLKLRISDQDSDNKIIVKNRLVVQLLYTCCSSGSQKKNYQKLNLGSCTCHFNFKIYH